MPTALDKEIKSRHNVIKPFTYGQGQTAQKGDVLNTSNWSGLTVHRMMKQGYLLQVPLTTSIKESDPYTEPTAKPKIKVPSVEAEEPTAAKKGSSKKKKGA